MFKSNVIFFITLAGSCFSEDSLLITTLLGKLKGQHRVSLENVEYKAFEGVPFAEPPVGSNRFQQPTPIQAWKGVKSAEKTKDSCWGYYLPQIYPGRYAGSEDCLYLNVYVPEKPTSTPLPVIIFIYGGAFQYSTLQGTEQERFMDKNLIFVTFNYRHGVLGFLSTEDEVVPGNMGLKDQVLAIQWVKDHIGSFGGNSSRITIAGISSGAASVHYHYLSPMTKGLFQGGISVSGTALMPWAQARNSREKTFKLGEILGCGNRNIRVMIECLREKPGLDLVKAQANFTVWRDNYFSAFGPVVERSTKDPFIDRSPVDIINNGDAHGLPWITGMVSEEGLFPVAEFCTNETVMKELDDNWDSLAPHLLQYYDTVPKSKHTMAAQKIRRYYFGDKPINEENSGILIRLVGDRAFGVDSMKAAKLQAKANKQSVWYYYFTYRSSQSVPEVLFRVNKNYGTSHGDDVFLFFKPLDTLKKEDSDLRMQRKLIDLWVSVAHIGKPNFQPQWQKLSSKRDDFNYLKISGPDNFEMLKNNSLASNEFWDSIEFNENIKSQEITQLIGVPRM